MLGDTYSLLYGGYFIICITKLSHAILPVLNKFFTVLCELEVHCTV